MDFSPLLILAHFYSYFPFCLVQIMKALDFGFAQHLRTLADISQNASSQGHN